MITTVDTSRSVYSLGASVSEICVLEDGEKDDVLLSALVFTGSAEPSPVPSPAPSPPAKGRGKRPAEPDVVDEEDEPPKSASKL